MSLRQCSFLLYEALTGIRRNLFMSLAAVSTVAASLFLLGSVRLVTANIEQLAGSLSDRFEIRVFLRTPLPPTERDALGKQIAALPGVSACRLVTKEEAWPEMQKRLAGSVRLDDLGGANPLPDAFVAQTTGLGEMGAVADSIRRLPGVDEVIDTREAAAKVAAIARALVWSGALATGILLVGAALIVGNAIRLTVHVRRLEIRIMQTVGATNGFIRTPFLLEGLFQGALGAAVAGGLLVWAYASLHREAGRAVPLLQLLPPSAGLFVPQIEALLGLGAALGLASSYLAMRKYLRW